MKKIVFEIIQVVIAYIIITVYGYYNTPEPDNKYSWLISAVIIIIVYSIIKLVINKMRMGRTRDGSMSDDENQNEIENNRSSSKDNQ